MQTRSVRLTKLRDLFRGNRHGFTPAELANTTGMSVRQIQRDLKTLEFDMGMPLKHEGGRYSMSRPDRLGPLNLDLDQARALLIATRLFVRYSDESDPFAVTALEQIASIMPEPVRAQVKAAIDAIQKRPFDAEFARNLSEVTRAWARRRVLKLSYRSAGKQRPKEVIVEPYFLEPSAAGFATYLIGHSQTHGSIRTFKIERIVSAEMLPRSFEVPDGVELDNLLSSAWGIIWGEGIDLVLRFKPEVAWRVKESKWHPSQSLEELDDGSCILRMSVASMMEVGRWVRSWGDTVEVLAPRALREELRREWIALARTYAGEPKMPRSRAKRKRGGSVA